MWTLLLFASISPALAVERETKIIVTTPQGPVVGYKENKFDIFTFKNIPYATIPTGEHRFKAPLPPTSWKEPLDAADKEIVCPQGEFASFTSDTIVMQEECLVATVYVPNMTRDNMPVVVYVHGGAFIVGFANSMTPMSLVDSKNVIAVTFNYRLSAHGFLCLGTNDIPGNAGMKDQVALLHWVQKNVGAFGGNPEDVTIAGYSAGGSSVDLLMLSETTKGLFHRVIPESGANIAAFSIQSNPIQNAKEYAKLLGFNNVEDGEALEEYFKNITIEHLNSVDTLERLDSTFLLSPCVETQTNEDSFLEDDPVSILKSGNYVKLPMLYGFSNMEGLFRIELFDIWKKKMNENFADFLPADLLFRNIKQKQRVAKTIKNFYFGKDEVNKKNVLSYVDFFTDVFFAYPALRSVKLQVEAGNNEIYLYKYSYVDENTPYVPHTHIRGAEHCAQTSVILDSLNLQPERQLNSKMGDTMKKIWLNFIITGNPNNDDIDIPQWPPVGGGRSPHMSLNETSRLRGSLLKKRAEFWDEIYEKYYVLPIPPFSTQS